MARRASLLWTWVLAALLAVLTSSARADVWAYIDERGVPHFASERLDERYELFFKQAHEPATSIAPGGPQYPRQVAVPKPQAKLLAFFEIAPSVKRVQHLLRDAARANGLDVELLQALIATESGFDPTAVSPRGAVGLMQIMPTTAERWGVRGDERLSVEQKLMDPRINIHAGSRLLRHLLAKYPGRLDLALAAYNAGEGAVARVGNRVVPAIKETQDYVKTVQQIYDLLKPPAPLASHQKLAIKSEAHGVTSGVPRAPLVRLGGAHGRGNMLPSLAGLPEAQVAP